MKKFFQAIKHIVHTTPVWFYMAHQDIVARYRRTVLGPWWITAGTGLGLTGMAIAWSTIFQVELQEFFPYITAGFITWMFISSTLVEGPTIFCIASGVAKTIKISLLTFIFSFILRNLYIMLHNFIIIFIVAAIFKIAVSWVALLVIPGLLINILAATFLSIILAIIGARYRDLSHIIGSLMTFIFLFTPVMWNVSMLKGKAVYVAYLNPLYYFLVIMRDPILNKVPSMIYYYGSISITLTLMIIAGYMYSKFENRLIYWI